MSKSSNDEFEDIGYTLLTKGINRVYKHDDGSFIYVTHNRVWKTDNWAERDFTYDEILACAKLITEIRGRTSN